MEAAALRRRLNLGPKLASMLVPSPHHHHLQADVGENGGVQKKTMKVASATPSTWMHNPMLMDYYYGRSNNNNNAAALKTTAAGQRTTTKKKKKKALSAEYDERLNCALIEQERLHLGRRTVWVEHGGQGGDELRNLDKFVYHCCCYC